MKTFNLTPINGRKSFNGKCKVIEENNIAKLLSYNTFVAQIDLNTKKFTENGTYSVTTKGHIKAFKNFYNI